MRSVRLLTISSLICALSACVSISPAKLSDKLQNWRGHALDELIMAFGPPGSQREDEATRYALWTVQNSSSTPSISIGIGGGSGHIGGSIATTLFGGEKLNYCTLQVFFDAEKIVRDVQWNGDPDLCDKRFSIFEKSN